MQGNHIDHIDQHLMKDPIEHANDLPQAQSARTHFSQKERDVDVYDLHMAVAPFVDILVLWQKKAHSPLGSDYRETKKGECAIVQSGQKGKSKSTLLQGNRSRRIYPKIVTLFVWT